MLSKPIPADELRKSIISIINQYYIYFASLLVSYLDDVGVFPTESNIGESS